MMMVTVDGCLLHQVNFIGTFYAVACMVITAQYQIYVGTKQKELQLNSTQLLTNMMPVSAVIVLSLVPVLDNTGLFVEQTNALVNYTFTTVGHEGHSSLRALWVIHRFAHHCGSLTALGRSPLWVP